MMSNCQATQRVSRIKAPTTEARMASLARHPPLALATWLGDACVAAGVQVSSAESCTGGGVAAWITAVEGSSRYFSSSLVTYSNAAKRDMLGVPADCLDAHGAVSEPVVTAMVAGVCRVTGADIAVAISGVAGPGGGSVDKPVGTVWLAVGNQLAQRARCLHLSGDRLAVREQSAQWSLAALLAVAQA